MRGKFVLWSVIAFVLISGVHSSPNEVKNGICTRNVSLPSWNGGFNNITNATITRLQNKTTLWIEECCPGYKNISGICKPQCRASCENGYCSKPNNCTCHIGYRWNDKAQACKPQCPSGCKNGFCSRPGFCKCHNGYVQHNATTCRRPVCSKPCINGKCVKDNHCKCNDGYVMSHDSKYNVFKCKPYCNNDCKHGDCVFPKICICHNGFHFNEKTAKCDPVCHQLCTNGFSCVAPNHCGCKGHIKTKTVKRIASTTVVEECISSGTSPFYAFILVGIMVVGVICYVSFRGHNSIVGRIYQRFH